jgi:hypothetical protein
MLEGDYIAFKDLPGIMAAAMTPEIAKLARYAPNIDKEGRPIQTYCNICMYDTIMERFGPRVHELVYGTSPIMSANDTFEAFEKNPNLEALDPNASWTMDKIQAEIDKGYLILAAGWRSVGSGHLGLGGPSSLEMWAIPGKINTALPGQDAKWTIPPQGGTVGGQQYPSPLIVMAGSYNGMLAFNYAFGQAYINAYSKENYQDGFYNLQEKTLYKMRFYRIKNGGK